MSNLQLSLPPSDHPVPTLRVTSEIPLWGLSSPRARPLLVYGFGQSVWLAPSTSKHQQKLMQRPNAAILGDIRRRSLSSHGAGCERTWLSVNSHVELAGRQGISTQHRIRHNPHEHLILAAVREFHVITVVQLRGRGFSINHRHQRDT